MPRLEIRALRSEYGRARRETGRDLMFISWGKSCVSLPVEHIRETYRKNDSEIHAGVLVGEEVHQNGAGPMNNSVMIALKIGQYNETCR